MFDINLMYSQLWRGKNRVIWNAEYTYAPPSFEDKSADLANDKQLL